MFTKHAHAPPCPAAPVPRSAVTCWQWLPRTEGGGGLREAEGGRELGAAGPVLHKCRAAYACWTLGALGTEAGVGAGSQHLCSPEGGSWGSLQQSSGPPVCGV